MYQYDDPTVSATLPAPAAPATPGFFTDGNPSEGEAATILRSDFMNMLMMELLNIVDAGGETPSKTSYNQVLTAIQALIGQPQTNKVSGVVGQARNLFITAAANSATSTLTADELIVESALGGLRYCLSNLNLTGNLSTQMDTGSAPVSGYVAKYVIFNPAAALSGTNPRVLYSNATLAKAASVYGGANMPSGYTASALVSVLPTNGSGNFGQAVQCGRRVARGSVSVYNSSTQQASLAALPLATAVPLNAVECWGGWQCSGTAASAIVIGLASDASGTGQINNALTGSATASAQGTAWTPMLIGTPQTLYFTATFSGSGTPTFIINVVGYKI